MDSDKSSSSRVHVLADEDDLIANPTFKNLSRILEHINSVLRDPLCSLIPETVSLVCKLIPIEEHLPCAPFTIDKIMLSLAERSPHQFSRIMAVMKTRIQNARSSQCVEACEVVLSYSVLNNIWNKDCDERFGMVDGKFRKKIAKRRAARLNLKKKIADASGLPYEDIFDVARFFTQDYFLGETCWNPVLPRYSASVEVKLLDRQMDSDSLAVDAGKAKCRTSRDEGPCPCVCVECLLARYMARAPIEMSDSCGTSFAQQFLFSYYLICIEEYRNAKDCLKAILLNLKAMDADVECEVNVCSKRPKDTSPYIHEGIEKKKVQNAQNTDIEEHIVAIKLHVYNLISFCHLYLGDYTELCYYIVRAINISNSDAFLQRKRLVDFIASAGRPPGLDVWIREIEFAGGLFAKNFDTIKDMVLARYFWCKNARELVHSNNRSHGMESQPCGREVDLFFLRLLKGRRFLDRKLVLNILMRNERSILRELKHEASINPSIFAKSTTAARCVYERTSKNKDLPDHADICAGLEESALYMHLLSMIPPETKVFSFYMIEGTLFVNEYPCCRFTTVPRFDATLCELADILRKSKETLKQNVSTRKDAKDWWEKRHDLDDKLGGMLADLCVDIIPSECNALLVDAQLHNFPFEACNAFSGKRVFRIPSLSFLYSSSSQDTTVMSASTIGHSVRIKTKKNSTDLSCTCGSCTVKRSISATVSTRALPISIQAGTAGMFYLLDLLGNLEKSRIRLKPLLSCIPGVAGRLPNAEELDKARSIETLLYFGHGNGSRYLRGCRNKHMGLFGCSSARTLWCSNFNLQGAICSYLKNCVFLLGCLWDVTDHDLDEIARCVLERGEIDRSVCRLRHLNGAAVVVYGIW